jgi:hypothetical protein
MRIRSTKPEFWRSERIASVSWDARLVLKGLESYVDDNGVGKDDIALIVGDIFSRDMLASPRETVARVSEAITELSQAGLLWRYDAENTRLLYIAWWESIQRIDKPGKGRFPRPDGTLGYGESDIRESVAKCRESVAPGTGEQGNRGTGESLVTYVSGEISEAPAKPTPAKKKGTRISGPDWMPQQKTVDRIKAAFPHVSSEQLRNEHELFICWATSSASSNAVKLDWDATWSGWMRRELVKVPNGTNGKPHKLRALADLAAEVREMETTNGKALEA